MNDVKKIKGMFVNHTHWDREWYFTDNDALVLSDQVFTDLIEELETHEEVSFCLDGQMSILEDYLQINPSMKQRVSALVQQKKLFIGPWYTQTDALLVDGESILRNLQIGLLDAHEFGEPMMVGYLPDTFGFNAQMPMLLTQAGIDNMIFWRGIDLETQVSDTYFKWKSLGNEEVFVANIPKGYGVAPKMQTTAYYVKNRLGNYMKFMEKHTKRPLVLIPAGGDQQTVVHNIHDKIDAINKISEYDFELGSYPEFIESIRTAKDLETYQGEFRLPKYARVHRSIGGIRVDIKQANYKLEHELIHTLEPLLVLAEFHDVHVSRGLLHQIWKDVLSSQAHDSMGGCVYDEVAENILLRYKKAYEKCLSIENIVMKKITEKMQAAGKMHPGANEVLLANLSPKPGIKEFNVVVYHKNDKLEFSECEHVELLNKTYFPERKDTLYDKPDGRYNNTEPGYYRLEYRIRKHFQKMGVFPMEFSEVKDDFSNRPLINWKQDNKVYDQERLELKQGKKIIRFSDNQLTYYENQIEVPHFIQLLDTGNDGDTYDFSPLEGEKEKVLPFQAAWFEQDESGNPQKMIVRGETALPAALVDRQNKALEVKIFSYQLALSFKDELLNIEISIDNTVKDHRIRVAVNTGIDALEAYSGLYAGQIGQPKNVATSGKLEEFPAPIYNFDKFVTVTSEEANTTVYADGIKEYQYDHEKLLFTLFSTCGMLGKSDLAWRPGRASGDTTKQGHRETATPLAQCLGTYQFHLSIGFEAQTADFNKIHNTAQTRMETVLSYQMQDYNYFEYRLDNKVYPTDKNVVTTPGRFRMTLPEDYIVSGLYPSYTTEKAAILRLTNPSGLAKDISRDDFNFHYGEAWRFKVTPIDLQENAIVDGWTIPPYNAGSYMITFEKEGTI